MKKKLLSFATFIAVLFLLTVAVYAVCNHTYSQTGTSNPTYQQYSSTEHKKTVTHYFECTKCGAHDDWDMTMYESHSHNNHTWTGQYTHKGTYDILYYGDKCVCGHFANIVEVTIPCNGNCNLPWGVNDPEVTK